MDRATRASLRRRTWSGGRVAAGQNATLEREFWAAATPEERLAAMWEMAQQVWRTDHPDGPPLRLDRSVGGVRRFKRASGRPLDLIDADALEADDD